MRNALYVFTLAGLCFLYSCEKDEPNIVKGTCQLMSTTFNIPNDPAKTLTMFSYNGSDQLVGIVEDQYDLSSSVDYSSRWALSYTGDKLDKITEFTTFLNDPEEEGTSYSFFYEGDLVDSIAVDLNRPNITGSYTHLDESFYDMEYDGKKLVKLTEYKTVTADNSIDSFETTLIWTGNNITEITGYFGSTLITTTYTYDDKKTPLRNFGLSFTGYGALTGLSENNVLTSRFTLSGTLRGVNNIMEYNNNDYPTSITSESVGSSYAFYPTLFEYTCN
jgi:hypothetical protein